MNNVLWLEPSMHIVCIQRVLVFSSPLLSWIQGLIISPFERDTKCSQSLCITCYTRAKYSWSFSGEISFVDEVCVQDEK